MAMLNNQMVNQSPDSLDFGGDLLQVIHSRSILQGNFGNVPCFFPKDWETFERLEISSNIGFHHLKIGHFKDLT